MEVGKNELLEILQGCVIALKHGMLSIEGCIALLNTLISEEDKVDIEDLVKAESALVKADFLENI